MPYQTNADLPASVRHHLPEHAQDIYREAFNHAYAAHAGESRQEEAAHRIAWAAVKRSLRQGGRQLGSAHGKGEMVRISRRDATATPRALPSTRIVP
jgi:cation transport regulator